MANEDLIKVVFGGSDSDSESEGGDAAAKAAAPKRGAALEDEGLFGHGRRGSRHSLSRRLIVLVLLWDSALPHQGCNVVRSHITQSGEARLCERAHNVHGGRTKRRGRVHEREKGERGRGSSHDGSMSC